jgi:hypothetical protein
MSHAAYMPILKGRPGENWALREQGWKPEVYPVVQIPRIVWDRKRNAPKTSLDDHVKKFLVKLGFRNAMQSARRCAVDGCLLDGA